jgi:hypothetical protein
MKRNNSLTLPVKKMEKKREDTQKIMVVNDKLMLVSWHYFLIRAGFSIAGI